VWRLPSFIHFSFLRVLVFCVVKFKLILDFVSFLTGSHLSKPVLGCLLDEANLLMNPRSQSVSLPR